METCYEFIDIDDVTKLLRLLKTLIAQLKVVIGRVINDHVRKSEELFSSPMMESQILKESDAVKVEDLNLTRKRKL
jgi:predicted GNAT family N-acyltransferase